MQQVNYPPISITSLISKAMETIITEQLLTFLETNNLLSDHLHGFWKARSTGDLLAYAVYVCSSALESCGESRVVSLDISKAFDRVWHKDVLAKLPIFGLHQALINWIGSFLSDRSIGVRVDGFLSTLHSINAGVPQGSVISPVLFILFINDLLASKSSSIHSFADDTFLSSSFSFNPNDHASTDIQFHRNISALLLSNDLTIIDKWGKDNLVSFNQSKTTQAVISRKVIKTFHLSSWMVMNWTLQLLSHNLVFLFHSISLGKLTSIPLLNMYLKKSISSPDPAGFSHHLTCWFYASPKPIHLESTALTSGVALQSLLSVFSTNSSPKPFVSSTVLTSPNLSNHFPISV